MYDDSFGSALKRGYMAMPVAIRTIITICLVMFIITMLGAAQFLVSLFAFDPDPVVTFTQPWRLITYMFLHASPLHIIFNMLWLWWMGRAVEEQLGPRNFSVLFFGAGIGGALINTAVVALLGGGNVTIGASGGVLGIMVCFAMMFPRMPIMLIFLPPIEARFIVAGLILIDVLFLGAGDNVARIVHLGGAFTGFVLLKLYYSGYHYDLWIELFMKKFKRKPKKSAGSSGGTGRRGAMHSVSDAEVVDEEEQSELDRILEKISKEGYEGLTDKEKKALFELSKRN